MKLLRIASTLVLTCGLAFAESRSYTIQPTPGSRLELRIDKTGLLRGKQHLFVFDRYSGTIVFDAANPEATQVALTVDAGSGVCKDTWVSAKDLRKIQEFALKDMLDAARHPNIEFKSTAIHRSNAERFDVEGMLIIRGTAKPVKVSVTLSNVSGTSLAATGSAQIRLTDYGLKPPTAALGTIGTKNEMQFSFSLAAKGRTAE